MYRLETENFLLEMGPEVHENDLSFRVNTNLSVKVVSYGFSAEAVMDIDVRELVEFALRLNELYETLEGSARLEEPYGMRCYIEFTACGRGHIKVRGEVHNGMAYEHEQKLTFENEIDQTDLKTFAKALLADDPKFYK